MPLEPVYHHGNDVGTGIPTSLEPVSSAAITIDNAEALLTQVVTIANRDLFTQVENWFNVGVDAVRGASSAVAFEGGITTPTNDLTNVEGTGGGPSPSNFGGFYGGEFTCDAGGTAEGISIRGGEIGDGYIITLDNCALADGRYTGQATATNGGRSGTAFRGCSDIEIVTEDGSRLIATPFDADADTVFESMQIVVSNETLLVPVTDGYLLNCRSGQLSPCGF